MKQLLMNDEIFDGEGGIGGWFFMGSRLASLSSAKASGQFL